MSSQPPEIAYLKYINEFYNWKNKTYVQELIS